MTNGNDLASPFYYDNGMSGPVIEHGLSKREYFAAMRKEPIFGSDPLSVTWAEVIMESELPQGVTIGAIKWWAEAHERFTLIKVDALIAALNK